MSNERRPKRETMSVEEATVSNMREIAAIVPRHGTNAIENQSGRVSMKSLYVLLRHGRYILPCCLMAVVFLSACAEQKGGDRKGWRQRSREWWWPVPEPRCTTWEASAVPRWWQGLYARGGNRVRKYSYQ
jgi:hypothetical protein